MPFLNFSTDAKSRFLRWHPVRASLNQTYKIYRLFVDPIEVKDKNEILVKSTRESVFDHSLRVQLAQWSPDSTTAIDMVLSSVFRSCPRRMFNDSEDLENWIKDVDNHGTDLTTYVKKQTRLTLAYGSSFTLMNLPKRPIDLVVNSLADEKPFLTPILRTYNPLQLLNWITNPDGQLQYIMFIEKVVLHNAWFLKWTEVDLLDFREWVKPVKSPENEDPVLHAEGSHNFGFVPVIPSYYDLVEPMVGRSYIEQSAMLDIKKFIQEADLEFDRFMLSHPMLVIKATEEIGQIEVDASKYLKLQPTEEASYLSIDKAPYEVNAEAIIQTRMDIARKLRIDPLGFVVQEGKVQMSGIARQLSFALNQSDTLTTVANVAESLDNDILKMAYIIIENTNEGLDSVSTAYEKDFSLTAIDTQMEVYKEIGAGIKSETFHKEMNTRFANALIGNNPSLNEEIAAEIDGDKSESEETVEEDTEEEFLTTGETNEHTHQYQSGDSATQSTNDHTHTIEEGASSTGEAAGHTHSI